MVLNRMAGRSVRPTCIRVATFVSSIAKGRTFRANSLLQQPTHGNAKCNVIDATEVAQPHLPTSV